MSFKTNQHYSKCTFAQTFTTLGYLGLSCSWALLQFAMLANSPFGRGINPDPPAVGGGAREWAAVCHLLEFHKSFCGNMEVATFMCFFGAEETFFWGGVKVTSAFFWRFFSFKSFYVDSSADIDRWVCRALFLCGSSESNRHRTVPPPRVSHDPLHGTHPTRSAARIRACRYVSHKPPPPSSGSGRSGWLGVPPSFPPFGGKQQNLFEKRGKSLIGSIILI